MRKWNNGVLEYWGIAESPASGTGFATITFTQEFKDENYIIITTYGMTIPEEYQSEPLKTMVAAQNV